MDGIIRDARDAPYASITIREGIILSNLIAVYSHFMSINLLSFLKLRLGDV